MSRRVVARKTIKVIKVDVASKSPCRSRHYEGSVALAYGQNRAGRVVATARESLETEREPALSQTPDQIVGGVGQSPEATQARARLAARPAVGSST